MKFIWMASSFLFPYVFSRFSMTMFKFPDVEGFILTRTLSVFCSDIYFYKASSIQKH